jgi:serine/threonine protein kinase/tetratricopeptide (TPR) repeat protein
MESMVDDSAGESVSNRSVTNTWDRVKELFHQALPLDAAGRNRLLSGLALALRADVESLLAAEEVAPPERIAEGPGSRIGRYKLLQEIGEGGFGVVYCAEQQEPVRRKVALKVIKLGMDSKQVVARFEAERQALALMDHPNIAQVFDAGTTDTGRPYFVMELVKGVSLTDYCNDAALDMKSRLELFQTLCHAVQHAHQKGIIHRDLKPSNVLVTLHGNLTVPKIIDFGIAKATSQRLTEKTLFTEFRQIVGTPEYMAPEQAEYSALDVDTRADIYSLGVLLYELLTGTKPFEMNELLEKGYDELLRTIREVDPPKPSTRVSTQGQIQVRISSSSPTAARILGKQLSGDLDWIVMKALDKSRSRRYESAHAFARDIAAYLSDQPVTASPPSATYRLHKYVRRHRVAALAATLILLSLLGGLAAAGLGLWEARRQRDLAQAREQQVLTEAEKANSVVDLMTRMISSADPDSIKGPDYTVRELLGEFDREFQASPEISPEVVASMRTVLGQAYFHLGMVDAAENHVDAALALAEASPQNTAEARADATILKGRILHQYRRQPEAAFQWLSEGLELQQRLHGPQHTKVADALICQSHVMGELGRMEETEVVLQRALAAVDASAPHSPEWAATGLLGEFHHQYGDPAKAESFYRRSLDLLLERYGTHDARAVSALCNIAKIQAEQGKLQEAEENARNADRLWEEQIGATTPQSINILRSLAYVLTLTGHPVEALSVQRKAVGLTLGFYSPEDEMSLVVRGELATGLIQLGLYAEAAAEMTEILVRLRAGGRTENLIMCLTNLGQALTGLGQLDRALEVLQEAESLGQEHLKESENNAIFPVICINLGLLYQERQDLPKAAQYQRKAIALLHQHYGEHSPRVIAAMTTLGQILRHQGQLDEALAITQEALIRAREHTPGTQEHAATASNMATLLPSAQAIALLEEAVQISTQCVGDQNPSTRKFQFNLGCALHDVGEVDRAIPLILRNVELLRVLDGTRFLAILESLFAAKHPAAVTACRDLTHFRRTQHPGGHPELAQALTLLGRALLTQDQHEEANQVLTEALQYYESQSWQNWRHSETLSLLGASLAGLAEYEDAEQMLLESYEQLATVRTQPQAHKQALRRLIDFYEDLEEPEEAAHWRALAER